MDRLVMVLAVAAATYATRIAGFTLSGHGIPRILDRFLDYVPVAVFAALVAPNLGIGTRQLVPRLVGAAIAVLVVLRVRGLWAGLVAGMAAYWLMRALVAI